MKFIVEKKFFESVPNACFGVIIARNIDNTKDYEIINNLFESELAKIPTRFPNVKAKELPTVELYREAFRKLNINPNKYMCSIEALLSRTIKTGELPHINSLVDLGNALSIKYIVPLGIHDIDKINGNIEVRFAEPEDKFIPFGSTEVETPDEGEVIYVSNHDVRTRRWTWRQGENGKVEKDIKNAFIPMDGFTENKEEVLKLQEEFKSILESMGVDVTLGFVDADNNEFEF